MRRGEPQAGQRGAPCSARVRQSRQSGPVSMSVVPAIRAGEDEPGGGHLFRRDPGLGCKGDEIWLVSCEVVEHGGEKAGFARGGAKTIGIEAGQRQEASQPVIVARNVANGLNCDSF